MAVKKLGFEVKREFKLAGNGLDAILATGKLVGENKAESVLKVVEPSASICREVCLLAANCALYAEVQQLRQCHRAEKSIIGAYVCDAECPNPELVDMATTDLTTRISVVERAGL